MKLTTKKHEDGYTHFYLNDIDVTNEWMMFFSGLSMEQEGNCKQLFIEYMETKRDCTSMRSVIKANFDTVKVHKEKGHIPHWHIDDKGNKFDVMLEGKTKGRPKR